VEKIDFLAAKIFDSLNIGLTPDSSFDMSAFEKAVDKVFGGGKTLSFENDTFSPTRDEAIELMNEYDRQNGEAHIEGAAFDGLVQNIDDFSISKSELDTVQVRADSDKNIVKFFEGQGSTSFGDVRGPYDIRDDSVDIFTGQSLDFGKATDKVECVEFFARDKNTGEVWVGKDGTGDPQALHNLAEIPENYEVFGARLIYKDNSSEFITSAMPEMNGRFTDMIQRAHIIRAILNYKIDKPDEDVTFISSKKKEFSFEDIDQSSIKYCGNRDNPDMIYDYPSMLGKDTTEKFWVFKLKNDTKGHYLIYTPPPGSELEAKLNDATAGEQDTEGNVLENVVPGLKEAAERSKETVDVYELFDAYWEP
jgi:hypothetical protein